MVCGEYKNIIHINKDNELRRTHPLQQSATQAYLALRLPRRKLKSVSYRKDENRVEGDGASSKLAEFCLQIWLQVLASAGKRGCSPNTLTAHVLTVTPL